MSRKQSHLGGEGGENILYVNALVGDGRMLSASDNLDLFVIHRNAKKVENVCRGYHLPHSSLRGRR